MPEQLTKHPDVTLQVLRSAGAKCAAGAPQEILTSCPAARFCKLPGGEICVYGLADAPRMTQITAGDWQSVLQAVGASGAAAPGTSSTPGTAAPAPATASSASTPASAASTAQPGGVPAAPLHPSLAAASALGIMLIGVAIGWKLRRPP